MSTLSDLQQQFAEIKRLGLNLNMQRGQPADNNFDLSNEILTIVDGSDVVTGNGVAIRNYPGGIPGLAEARALFADMLGVEPEEMIVGNNASLRLLSTVWMWALLRGLLHSEGPWVHQSPKMIVTIPAYDRHFKLAAGLGFELVTVDMTEEGPDIDAIETLVANDASVKGIIFVPTYSNPTGEAVSDEIVRRLAAMPTAAPDFTIFADDAYVVHHLSEEPATPLNFLKACKEAGNADRVYIFGSTSKMTFAGAGIGFFGTSVDNVAYISKLMGLQAIGPNKVEQYRHVKFLSQYPGGIDGLMAAHGAILRPKFEAVQTVLDEVIGHLGLATWTNPKGGYFVSLNTDRPVASRVVELAKEAGVALTPAGATYPGGKDPHNKNIRLAPSRPPVNEVEQAMRVVALCIQLASAEYDSQSQE